MDIIPNGNNPEWKQSRMETIRMEKIPNGNNPKAHHPEWTQP